MKSTHRTTHQIKSLTFLLSVAEGAAIEALQDKRVRLRVPVNNREFDGEPGSDAWFFAIADMQLGNAQTPAPGGLTLRNPGCHRLQGNDGDSPRKAIISEFVFDLDIAADAAAFEAIPIIVKGFPAATDAPAVFSLPPFTSTPEPVFKVTDKDGGAVGLRYNITNLTDKDGGDAATLQGHPAADFALAAHSHPATEITDFSEAVQDAVAAALVAGSGQQITYDDASNTITFVNSAPLTAESVQDIVGAMVEAGTNVATTYDDATGKLLITASGGGGGEGGGFSQEEIEDIVASLLVAGSNVTLNYNDADGQLEIVAAGSGGGGTSTANQREVTQTAHGLAVGNWVKHAGTYAKARADTAANAEVLGMVAAVASANSFTLASDGYVSGLSGLSADTLYFLHPTTAGAMTATEPSTVGHVSRPVFYAVSSSAGYILNYRAFVIPEEAEESALTVNDSLASPASSGTVTQLLSWVAGRLKAITGKSSWLTAPAITLEALSVHRSRHVSGGADAFLASDVIEAVVKRLRESGGTNLTLSSINDGQILQRNGSSIVGLPTYIGASVYSSSMQSIPNSANTPVNFVSEEWDTHNFHSSVSNNSRLTVPNGMDGRYLVTGQVAFDNNASGHRNLKLRVNGTSSSWMAKSNATSLGSTDAQWLQVSHVLNLSAGEYVELLAFQNSGAALNIGMGVDESGGDERSWLQMTRLG